jgi:hypothetical protein
MQPGYDWPYHRAHHDGDKQDENDLVKPKEEPEANGDKNQDESRPHDPPECPVIQLRRWMLWHAFAWEYFGRATDIVVGKLFGFFGHAT